jgi:hypothetical protein
VNPGGMVEGSRRRARGIGRTRGSKFHHAG